MLTGLLVPVFAVIALVLLLLGIVVAGIRREPPTLPLNRCAPSLMAAVVRRLLGVYVRRPASPSQPHEPR